MNELSAPPLWLACLCAAWCRTCDDYQPVLQQVAAEFATAAPGLRVRWVDIEDEADLVGDVDIETFPTLAVLDAHAVRFFGPLTPQPETLRRVLRSTLLDADPPALDVPPAVRALAARLRGG
jgi:thioredoxin 1